MPPPVRLLALVALPLVELLLLGLRFDAGPLMHETNRAWSLLGHFHVLPAAACVMASTVLVLRGGALRESAAEWGALLVPPARPLLPLAAHLAATGIFALATAVLFEHRALRDAHAAAWVALWLGSAAVSALAWLGTVADAASWWALLRAARKRLLIAAGLTAVTLVAAWAASRSWTTLAVGTLWAVRGLLRLVGEQVVYQPARQAVGTPVFWVQIAPECSGSEGMALAVVLVGTFLFFSRASLRMGRALWLLPLAAGVMWVGNALRITALVELGAHVSPSVAVGGFHSFAGWILFCAVGLGVLSVARSSRWLYRPGAGEPSADAVVPHDDGTAAWLGPLVGGLAVQLVTAALSSDVGLDVLYPLHVLVSLALVVAFRRRLGEALRWPRRGPLVDPAALALGAAVFALWRLLAPGLPGASDQHAAWLQLSLAPRLAWIAARLGGAIVVAPLVEELAFRGYLQRRLSRAEWAALPLGRLAPLPVLFASLLFGLLHVAPGLGPAASARGLVAGTLAGVAFAVALHRRGLLLDAVAAHATANALLAGAALASGDWSRFS